MDLKKAAHSDYSSALFKETFGVNTFSLSPFSLRVDYCLMYTELIPTDVRK